MSRTVSVGVVGLGRRGEELARALHDLPGADLRWLCDRDPQIRLAARPLDGAGGEGEEIVSVFWVGFYDFPMIDNTRLYNGSRAAVVLREWTDGDGARLALAYFPSSRASLKDKPFYDEVIEELMGDSRRSAPQ